ncbi:MAG: phage holin family protein [Oscillospiraceae bacterium]|jgi:toxin secretion/phage lysis holin|nr:phage holin family protein [Oscillospiraceae bacterium]
MKENICTLIAVIGAIFTSLVGGWDSAMNTLVIFMAIDFMTGFVTAILGKSKHSGSGKLNSKAVWVGLAKKFCIILMVIVAMRIDILLETTYVRDATCIGFCVNELLSIVENTSLMGISYPPAMKKALEVLQKKAGHTNTDAQNLLDEIEKQEDDNGSKKL